MRLWPYKTPYAYKHVRVSEKQVSPQLSSRPTLNWRSTVKTALVINILITIANVSLLIVAVSRGTVLYDGECVQMKKISVAIDLLVNVVSTLVLGSSNFAMQCLGAPTRQEIDKAHAGGHSVQIGISSWRNRHFVPWSRKKLWIIILISSVPLHLCFNSVFISNSYAVNYVLGIVDQRFVQGAAVDHALAGSYNITASCPGPSLNVTCGIPDYDQYVYYTQDVDPVGDLLHDLQDSATNQSMKNISIADCYSSLTSDFVKDYNRILVVLDQQPGATSSVYDIAQPSVGASFLPNEPLDGAWSIQWPQDRSSQQIQISTGTVKYCLAEKVAQQSCQISLERGFLATVMVACLATICSQAVLLRTESFQPLVTVGDAVSSFLERLETPRESPREVFKGPETEPLWEWIAVRRRWRSAASPNRWGNTVTLWLLYWGFGLALFIQSLRHSTESFGTLWRKGLGAYNGDSLIATNSVFGNVLIANTPQIVLSFVYLCYNALITCLLASKEYTSYALERKGLRVTEPQGAQRSTYWLSVPLRYGAPLMLVSALLHWLMAQSLFLTEIQVYDTRGALIPDASINCVNWSVVGLLFLLILGLILLLVPALLGQMWNRSLMPLMRHDSREIWRACRARGGRSGEALGRVKFGKILGEPGGVDGRTGISSGEVGELEILEVYEQ